MSYNYDSLIFWPKKKIRRTFKEAEAAMGTDTEAAALRVFHERMSLFFAMADETCNEVSDLAVKIYKHARKQLSWVASFPKEESPEPGSLEPDGSITAQEETPSGGATTDVAPSLAWQDLSSPDLGSAKKPIAETGDSAPECAPPAAPDIDVIMKPYQGGVSGIEFTPAERLREIFQRMKSALNTPREAEELKIFYLRIDRMYGQAEETKSWADEEDVFKMAALGEALDNDRFLRSITGGADNKRASRV
jgi:hypothetical protein